MNAPQRTHDNNKSSLFEKLPEDLRRQLDLAIIYRYARRLRDRANLAEIAELAAEDDGDPARPSRSASPAALACLALALLLTLRRKRLKPHRYFAETACVIGSTRSPR